MRGPRGGIGALSGPQRAFWRVPVCGSVSSMPRANRTILPDGGYHLTHRSHSKGRLFRCARDRTDYCRMLRKCLVGGRNREGRRNAKGRGEVRESGSARSRTERDPRETELRKARNTRKGVRECAKPTERSRTARVPTKLVTKVPVPGGSGRLWRDRRSRPTGASRTILSIPQSCLKIHCGWRVAESTRRRALGRARTRRRAGPASPQSKKDAMPFLSRHGCDTLLA